MITDCDLDIPYPLIIFCRGIGTISILRLGRWFVCDKMNFLADRHVQEVRLLTLRLLIIPAEGYVNDENSFYYRTFKWTDTYCWPTVLLMLQANKMGFWNAAQIYRSVLMCNCTLRPRNISVLCRTYWDRTVHSEQTPDQFLVSNQLLAVVAAQTSSWRFKYIGS